MQVTGVQRRIAMLHHNSGLSSSAIGSTVEITDFTVDSHTPARLFGDVAVNGEQAVASALLFDLDGSTLNPPTIESGSAVIQGAAVKLSPEAADLLNQTFGTDARAVGMLTSVATITVPTS